MNNLRSLKELSEEALEEKRPTKTKRKHDIHNTLYKGPYKVKRNPTKHNAREHGRRRDTQDFTLDNSPKTNFAQVHNVEVSKRYPLHTTRREERELPKHKSPYPVQHLVRGRVVMAHHYAPGGHWARSRKALARQGGVAAGR